MFPLSDSRLVPALAGESRLPTIMIVGDPGQLNIAREALVELELAWDVIFAESAFDTLDIPSVRPVDIILVDFGSPHLDGVEVVSELHQRFPHLPIVLMSAPYSVHAALEGMNKGACNHFPRDLLELEPHAILHLLRSIVHKQQLTQYAVPTLDHVQYEFTLSTDRAFVPCIVERLKTATIDLGVCDVRAATRFGVALAEALLNAMIHGNMEIPSSSRQQDDVLFDALIRERSVQTPYATRRVRVTARITREEATVVIADEGRGFNVHLLPDPTTPENRMRTTGRGILLMRSYCSAVVFNDMGNVVTLVKKRT